ncbi:non-specific lipid-transfer protein 2 [Apium graveolens]|uniref:non-specific lipid-transfer protein 2 n=1 Tax=Apium graveolens TaxID=4045 RepID=UPI003D7A3C08
MKAFSCIAVCAVLVLLVCEAQIAVAVTCNPSQLAPCSSAITSDKPPSRLCCVRITQQRPCLCQYLKNPNLKKFVSSPNARKIASTCKVAYPRC